MSSLPWILIAVATLLILFGIAFFFLIKNKKRPPTDYYTLFILGIIWLAIGLPLGNYTLFILGLIFTIVGLLNKDKWEQNRRKWEDLDEDEKRFKLLLLGALGLLVLVAALLFVLAETGTLEL